MKNIFKLIAAVMAITLFLLALCACDAAIDPNVTADPSSTHNSSQDPDASLYSVMLHLPFSLFITDEDRQKEEAAILADSEGNTSLYAWTFDYAPVWELSDDGIVCIHEGASDILSVYDVNSGEKLYSIDMSQMGRWDTPEYFNGLFYALNESSKDDVNEIVVFNELGKTVNTFDIPDEVYDIPPKNPNLPDLLTYGLTYLETYGGELLLSIVKATNEKDYYSIDTQTGAITKTEAPYTITLNDDKVWVLKTKEGTELHLGGRERFLGIDDEGNIYTETIHGGGFVTYTRYDPEGNLEEAFNTTYIYTNLGRGVDMMPVPFGNDGSIYMMDHDDEGYILVRVDLNP